MNTATMAPLPENTETQAPLTGEALVAARQQLKAAFEGGQPLQTPAKQTNAVVVGVDTPQTDPTPAQPQDVPPIPEGGVEKFYNPETGAYDWQAHAKEAEFKARMASAKLKKSKPDKTDEGEETTPEKVVTSAGLDWNELGEKISVLGDIEEEDYEALERVGIPQEVVRAHIDGYKAVIELNRQKLYQKTGGQEGAQRLMLWAKQNLSEDEIAAYDRMLSGPEWPVAIDALMARANFRPSSPPSLLKPAQTTSVNMSGGYASQEEHLADIRNPLYKTSEAFRREVYAKLMRTPKVPSKGPFGV